jgi:hypothetical protein
MTDYNLANAGGAVITFEGRSPFLGFDVPEAVLLGNSAFSDYHAAQLGLVKRFSRGLEFNLSYTYSRAMDNASVDPGSTAGGGKPDLLNAGFTAWANVRHPQQLFKVGLDRTSSSARAMCMKSRRGSRSRWAAAGTSGFSKRSRTPFSTRRDRGELAQYSNLRLPQETYPGLRTSSLCGAA